MSQSSIPEVLVGLGLGIVFIALFASFFGSPKEQSATVGISDFGLTTYFLFSDLESKVVNFEVDFDSPTILMTVDVQQNTELRVRFHEHLFEQLERQQRPEGYRFGDALTVFVDEVQETQVTWDYTELEVIATLPLEAGTKTIEIVGTVLLGDVPTGGQFDA